jgi:cold shock CspA family protein
VISDWVRDDAFLGVIRYGTVAHIDHRTAWGTITSDLGDTLCVHATENESDQTRWLAPGMRVSFLWAGEVAADGTLIAARVRIGGPALPAGGWR